MNVPAFPAADPTIGAPAVACPLGTKTSQAACTRRRSSSQANGFAKRARGESSRGISAGSHGSAPEMRIAGCVSSAARARRIRSTPLRQGMPLSVTRTCTAPPHRINQPSSPSLARSTRYPSRCRRVVTLSSTTGSSSTTSTRMLRPPTAPLPVSCCKGAPTILVESEGSWSRPPAEARPLSGSVFIMRFPFLMRWRGREYRRTVRWAKWGDDPPEPAPLPHLPAPGSARGVARTDPPSMEIFHPGSLNTRRSGATPPAATRRPAPRARR